MHEVRSRLEQVRSASAPRNIAKLNLSLMCGDIDPDTVTAQLGTGTLHDSWQGTVGIFRRTASLARVASHAVIGARSLREERGGLSLVGSLSEHLTVVKAAGLLTYHSVPSGYSGLVIAAQLTTEQGSAVSIAVSTPEWPGSITPLSDQVRTLFHRVQS